MNELLINSGKGLNTAERKSSDNSTKLDFRKLIIKGSSESLIGYAIFQIMLFIFLFTKTHLLTPQDVGILALALRIIEALFIVSTGLNLTILRYGSLHIDDSAKLHNTVKFIQKLSFSILFGLMIIILLSAPFIALAFRNPELTLPLRILSFGFFLSSLSLFNASLLQSRYLVIYTFVFKSLQYFFATVAILFLAGFRNPIGFSIAITFGASLVYPLSAWTVHRLAPSSNQSNQSDHSHHTDHSVNKTKKASILKFAFFCITTQILLFSKEYAPFFLASIFINASDLALLHTALSVGIFTSILLRAVNSIFPPLVSNLFGKGKIQDIRRLHKKTSRVLFLSALAILFIYIFAGKLILSIFGSFYIQAYYPLLIVAFAQLVNASTGSVGYILNMMGRPHLNMIYSVITLVLVISASIILIPKYNIIGAALAYAVGTIFINILMLIKVWSLYRSDRTEVR